jgi:hypothetical protein
LLETYRAMTSRCVRGLPVHAVTDYIVDRMIANHLWIGDPERT